MANTKKESTNTNLDIYNKYRNPPQEALKPISAGRLRGFTDINPMWRIASLTDAFGPCGEGWYYEIVKQWIEDCGDEKVAFTNINLYIKNGEEWSKPITGTGGSKLQTKEKQGLYVSDEAYKMSLTDALSVAVKNLGMGADIYWANGRSKYTDSEQEYTEKKVAPKKEVPENSREKMLEECISHYNGDNLSKLLAFYKVTKLEELNDTQLTVAYNTAMKGR